MKFADLKSLYEARDQNENKLFKYCTFEWILDLLKDGVVYSYDVSLRDQKIEDKDDGSGYSIVKKFLRNDKFNILKI